MNPLFDIEANETHENHSSVSLVPPKTEDNGSDFEEQLESILGEDMQNFMLTLRDKYPILSMSEAELLAFTQSPEGEKEFWSQAMKFSEESLDYLVEQFSLLPPERLEEAFSYGEQWAMEQGQQIPPQFLQQTFDEVRQRLNMSR